MANASERSIPLAFPYYMGPGVRGMTSTLLYHGKLGITLPGWASASVPAAFNSAFYRALDTNHELLPVLRGAAHYFDLSQSHAQNMMMDLEPLKEHLSYVLAVYPGDTAAYTRWEPFHGRCLPIAHAALSDPLHSCVASLELVWRLHELALENGADPDDEKTLDGQFLLEQLTNRSTLRAGPGALLAECVLNRYCIPRSEFASCATDSEMAIALLAALGMDLGVDDSLVPIEPRAEALAFYFFDQLMPLRVRSFTQQSSPHISTLMSDHHTELKSLREKCKSLAIDLVSSPPTSEQFAALIRARLSDVRAEVGAITQLDASTTQKYLRALSEDPKVWASTASTLGIFAGMPDLLSAAFAVTAFSTLGAHAVKARNTKLDTLKNSPWSFVYYAAK